MEGVTLGPVAAASVLVAVGLYEIVRPWRTVTDAVTRRWVVNSALFALSFGLAGGSPPLLGFGAPAGELVIDRHRLASFPASAFARPPAEDVCSEGPGQETTCRTPRPDIAESAARVRHAYFFGAFDAASGTLRWSCHASLAGGERMKSVSLLACATALVLAGCAADRTGAPAGKSAAPAVGAAVSSGQPSPFDGVYTGPSTVTKNKNNDCDATMNRTLTVTNGEASFAYSRTMTVKGPVGADGTVKIQGARSGNVTTLNGRIDGGRFVGESDNQNCTYSVTLAKQG